MFQGFLSRQLVFLALGVPISVGLLGCGGGASKRAIKPITATVTYKGSPVADATVTFINQEGEPISAFGKTDAQGTVKPTTPQVGDGVVLGKHKVLVTKEEAVGGSPSGKESSDFAPPDATAPKVKDLVPSKYKAPGTTPLTVDVSSGGPSDFKLELAD